MKQKSPDRVDELKALGVVISGKIKDAVEARKNSGIETVWLACEEAYLGIDDANRHEFKGANWAKPTSMKGGLVEESSNIDNTKSTAFVRLTSRYVDAGKAKLGEIILQPGEKAFSLGPTPIPDLVDAEKDERPAVVNGAPLAMPPAPAPGAPPTAPSGLPMAAAAPMPGASSMPGIAAPETAPAPPPVTKISDLYAVIVGKAKEAAEAAEKRIYDWMVECGFHAEVRKVLDDSARIGVGVLKSPFPARKKVQAVVKVNGVVTLESKDKIRPAAKWIDPWNFFPDGDCGENIHDGDHCVERDFLSKGKVEDLKKNKTYLTEQIDKVLREGPNKADEESPNPNEKKTKGRYTVWYFYGRLTREEMLAANCVLEGQPKDKKHFFAIVTMINDSVVRATINPLDSGKLPFNAMPWTRRAGSWAGVGIAEQVSMPQRVCNASLRALLNNAGLSGGVQFVIDRNSIEPAVPNDWRIVPNKIWFKIPDATIDDMRKAFMILEFPNISQQLMAIIELGKREAEDASNIPLISQGQTGPMSPETLGQTEIQNTNANTLLRSIGHTYDSFINDPVIRGFYEWLLLDPDVPNEEKGDYEIDAHGTAALVERAIQENTLAQMGQMVMNPAFGINPKKWFEMWLKSKRLDPTKMQYSKEEQQKMDETPPPEPPQVIVAKINAASHEKIAGLTPEGAPAAPGAAPEAPDTSTVDAAQIRANTELEKAKAKIADAQADRVFDSQEAQKQRDHQIAMADREIQLKQLDMQQALQIRQMELEHEGRQNLDKSKVALAQTTITDETKREVVQQEVDLAREINAIEEQAEAPSLIRDDLTAPGTP